MNGVKSAIEKKGRSARTSMDKAWAKAKSYGYPIASVHVVRFGSGLRTAYSSSYTSFLNFVCDRSCNIWGSISTDIDFHVGGGTTITSANLTLAGSLDVGGSVSIGGG